MPLRSAGHAQAIDSIERNVNQKTQSQKSQGPDKKQCYIQRDGGQRVQRVETQTASTGCVNWGGKQMVYIDQPSSREPTESPDKAPAEEQPGNERGNQRMQNKVQRRA